MAGRPKVLTPQQSEELLQLEDDLRTLVKLVITFRKPLTEADVRIASVILRKWLAEGMLGRLCNSIGAKATFSVLDNSQIIEALKDPKHKVLFFLTGGISFNGSFIRGIYESLDAYEGEPLLPVEGMVDTEVKIGGFLDQKRIFYKDTFFTTAEIIKFCANKLGGAHYDLDRSGKYALLDEVYTYMMFGGPLMEGEEPSGQLYLPIQTERCPVLSGLHIEIVAAAASLIRMTLDGIPILQITVEKSWRSKLRAFFGLDRERRVVYPVDDP
jgi:hypothetical protein